MDRVPETWVSDFGSAMEKWAIRQIEQGFSSLFTNFFGIFDDFSNWSKRKEGAAYLRKIIKYSTDEEKPCSTCLKNPFFRLIPDTRKSEFRIPKPSLVQGVQDGLGTF